MKEFDELFKRYDRECAALIRRANNAESNKDLSKVNETLYKLSSQYEKEIQSLFDRISSDYRKTHQKMVELTNLVDDSVERKYNAGF